MTRFLVLQSLSENAERVSEANPKAGVTIQAVGVEGSLKQEDRTRH